MRKEPMKKFYANGIELKNGNGDFVKVKTLLKETMPDIWKAFMEGRIFIEKNPLTCETEYKNLQRNPSVKILKNNEFVLYIHEEEHLVFDGREYKKMAVVVDFMRLINNTIQ